MVEAITSPKIMWPGPEDKMFMLYPVEDGFYEATVNGLNHVFEYDHKPELEEVEDDFINFESAKALDELEAEFGADGRRWQASQALVCC